MVRERFTRPHANIDRFGVYVMLKTSELDQYMTALGCPRLVSACTYAEGLNVRECGRAGGTWWTNLGLTS